MKKHIEKILYESPTLTTYLKLKNHQRKAFLDSKFRSDAIMTRAEKRWYEIQELDGLDFKFSFKIQTLYINNGAIDIRYFNFDYIDGKLGNFNFSIGGGLHSFYLDNIAPLKMLKIRIPNFSYKMIQNVLNPEKSPLTTLYNSLLKYPIEYYQALDELTTHYIRRKISADINVEGLSNDMEDERMIEYLNSYFHKLYSRICIMGIIDDYLKQGWVMLRPETDMFDLIELLVQQVSKDGHVKDYIYLKLGTVAMGLENVMDIKNKYVINMFKNEETVHL